MLWCNVGRGRMGGVYSAVVRRGRALHTVRTCGGMYASASSKSWQDDRARVTDNYTPRGVYFGDNIWIFITQISGACQISDRGSRLEDADILQNAHLLGRWWLWVCGWLQRSINCAPCSKGAVVYQNDMLTDVSVTSILLRASKHEWVRHAIFLSRRMLSLVKVAIGLPWRQRFRGAEWRPL